MPFNYIYRDFETQNGIKNRRIILFNPTNYVLPTAFMSKYSRSTAESMVDTIEENKADYQQQDKMVNTVLNQYGHDSIAELANVQMSLENVSHIAINDIEKPRIGVSFIEKSTRYVDFSKLKYYIPDEIKADEQLLQQYTEAYDFAIDIYREAYESLQESVGHENPINQYYFIDSATKKEMLFSELQNPKDRERATKAHNSAIREYVLDNVANCLPSGITTSLAFNINFRALREFLDRLYSSQVKESRDIYSNIMDVIRPYSHVLLSRVDYPQQDVITYRKKQNSLFDIYHDSVINVYKNHIENYHDGFYYEDEEEQEEELSRPQVITPLNKPTVDLVFYNDGILNEAILCSAIMTEYNDISTPELGFRNILDYFNDDENNSDAQKRYLVQNYIKNRENKFNKIGISTEFIDFVIEIQSSYRTWRDLRRHRTCTRMTDKVISPNRGYIIPPEFHKSKKLMEKYIYLNKKFSRLYDLVLEKTGNYYIAQYCTLLGNVVKYTMKLNLREIVTMLELRSENAGHYEYYDIVNQIYEHIKINSKLLASCIKFMNTEKTKLGRLKANDKMLTRLT